jgi:hypothetical protein
MSFTAVTHCGTDHHEWLNRLDFYKNEFKIVDERLLEITQKNNGKEVMEGIEHFQNQFIVQKNNIDELKHEVNNHAKKVAEEAQHHAGKMDISNTIEHEKINEKISSLERVINELRHEFNLFLAKWM